MDRYALSARKKAVAGIVLGSLVALFAGFEASHVLKQRMLDDAQQALSERVAQLAIEVSGQTIHSPAMGATMLSGLGEVAFKSVLGDRDIRPAEDEALRALMRPLRRLFQADGVYLISGQGKIAVHESEGKSSVGAVVAFRPYFQQAMAGKPNVYAAVGSSTGERGLYYAAPVHAGQQKETPVVGVIMSKLAPDFIDAALKKADAAAVLLSPQGVVFASTEADWLFSMTPPVNPDRVAAIKSLKQFGKMFDGGEPRVLPFVPGTSMLEQDGRSYLLAEREIDWADPAGKWRVAARLDGATVISSTLLWTVGGLTWLLVMVMVVVGIVIWRSRKQREENRARQRMLGRALEESPVAVLMADADGLIRWVNPQFERNFGQGFESLFGKQARMVLGEERSPSLFRDMRRTLRDGRVWRAEVLNRRVDGTSRWDATTVSPVFDKRQRLLGYVVQQEDVSERRELIAKLEAKSELDDRLNRLSEVLKGELDPQVVAQAGFGEILRSLGLPYGALHAADPALGVLARIGGSDNMLPDRDGLVAHVVTSGRSHTLENLPPSMCVILAGQAQRLKSVKLLPVACSNGVAGVLELGQFEALDMACQAYLDQAIGKLAVALKMALDVMARQRMERRIAD